MATQSFTGWKQALCLAFCLLFSGACAVRLVMDKISFQADTYTKVPRKWCARIERTVGEEYCEGECLDYAYGELPNLQMGSFFGKGGWVQSRHGKIDDSKDVIVKIPAGAQGRPANIFESPKDWLEAQIKMLRNEAEQYKHLRGIPGIPDLIYAGPIPHQQDMVIIIDMFGMSFAEYMDYWKSKRHPEEERWPRTSELATVARDLLAILQQVHKRGYQHRNIKPENMMFKDGALYLTDLGKACPIGKNTCNVQGSPLYVSADAWDGKEQIVKDDLEMVINLVVYSSGEHTWDECMEDSTFIVRHAVNIDVTNVTDCLSEKKRDYMAKPSSCGVAGLDDVAKMIRNFDPALGDFDYDGAIALLTDHSALRFPDQEELDSAHVEPSSETMLMQVQLLDSAHVEPSSGAILAQVSISNSTSSVSSSSAGSLPN